MKSQYERKKTLVRQAIHEIIEEHGQCTPDMLVEHARPKESPIHCMFEWNAKKAAEQYRIVQAMQWLRSIHIEVESPSGESVRVREFVHIRHNSDNDDQEAEESDSRAGHYVTIGQAMDNPESMSDVVADAKRELQSFVRKYEAFSKLSGIVEGVKKQINAIERALR